MPRTVDYYFKDDPGHRYLFALHFPAWSHEVDYDPLYFL